MKIALAAPRSHAGRDGDRGRKRPGRLVVGVHGVSGSGKTSLLQLVWPDLASHTNVVRVKFNPWMLEASPGPLLSAFFATVSAAFRFENRPELRRLDRLLLPISLSFPDDDALRHLTLTSVNNACVGSGVILTVDEAGRFGQRFERALLPLVRTPRRARRYANTLALPLPLFKRENGCVVEHLCREGLRVLAPDAERLPIAVLMR